MMNYYEATYEKKFTGRNYRNTKDILVTAKDKIARLVNDSWIYSSHWPENEGWVKKAEEDIKTCLMSARERVRELEQAKSIIEGIVLS